MDVACVTVDLSDRGVADVRPLVLQEGSVVAIRINSGSHAALETVGDQLRDVIDHLGLRGKVMVLLHTDELDVRTFNAEEMRRFGYAWVGR